MEKEIWKGVIYNGINYGKYYEVSNLGRIRNTKTKKNLKLSIGNKGYYHFTMKNKNEGLLLRCSIHKVMAETFIPNPNNYPIINHKDGNKNNWSLDNLEWCTKKENMQHASEHGLCYMEMVRVVETGQVYQSYTACARAIGGTLSGIHDCKTGRQHQHRGYHFEFLDEGDTYDD